ncbi:MAG: hydrogenase 3 maturation endopeptidase HyCI [Candidatus Omnitrophica bacterium]|nr:hydrogenase 3 maturation endopeptidase HyCI [Candidatus Omnitrophota bacterium]
MSNLLAGNTGSVTNLLTPQEFSHTLIITVGNCFRADDGVGPYIASGLKPSVKLSVIDAGSTPGNIIDQAIKLFAQQEALLERPVRASARHPALSERPVRASAQRIIFIDAADFGGAPGELRLIDAEHIPESTLSTHSMPLPVISRILYEDTQAEIYFIGIQPKSVEHKDGLSKEVSSTADALIKHINQEFKDA